MIIKINGIIFRRFINQDLGRLAWTEAR